MSDITLVTNPPGNVSVGDMTDLEAEFDALDTQVTEQISQIAQELENF